MLFRSYVASNRVWVTGRDITDEKLGAARLEILATASRAFSEATTDVHTLFDTIARHIAEVIHDGCVIRLVSPDGETFEAPVGVWDRSPDVLAVLKELPAAKATDGAGGEIMRTGRPILIAKLDPRDVAERFSPPDRRDFTARLGIHT